MELRPAVSGNDTRGEQLRGKSLDLREKVVEVEKERAGKVRGERQRNEARERERRGRSGAFSTRRATACAERTSEEEKDKGRREQGRRART